MTTDIAKIETDNGLFKISAYKESGFLVNTTPSVPIRLHKFDGDKWNVIEEWDRSRKNGTSRKSDTLALQEGLSKIPLYDKSEINFIETTDNFEDRTTFQYSKGGGKFSTYGLVSSISPGDRIYLDELPENVFVSPIIRENGSFRKRFYKIGNKKATAVREPTHRENNHNSAEFTEEFVNPNSI